MRITWLLVSSFAIASIIGCGDDSSTGGGGSGGNPTSGPGPSSGGGGEAPASCDFDTLDLEGAWALVMTVPTEVEGAPGGAFTVCPATQQDESKVVLLMDVTALAPSHSARFTVCAVDTPAFKASPGPTCVPADTLDVDLYDRDGIFDESSEPVSIDVASAEPGAAFTIDPLAFYFGSGPPLPTWDTGDVACDDIALGHGACEEACVSNCEVDYWNDDFPGFSLGVCGLDNGELLEDCDVNDPGVLEPDEQPVTLQGKAYTTFDLSSTIGGSFTTSCEASVDVTLEFAMSVIGGNLYLGPDQTTVTSMVSGFPSFTLAGAPTSAKLVRVDGLYGSPALETGDREDTCRAILENLPTLEGD